MREYVVSLRRGADIAGVSPTGSLADAVDTARVRVTEILPTGQTVVVVVQDDDALSRLQSKLGKSCHVVQRIKGHTLR